MQNQYEEHRKIANELIYPMWRCVAEKFKTDNPKDVWRYFENFIKTSANAKDLPNFFGKFKRLCPFDWQHKYEKQILESFNNFDNDKTLSILQGDDCAFVILLTRTANNERKELLKLKNDKK